MSSKISQLQETISGTSTDLLHILDDNGNSTYTNKKITAANLFSSLENKVLYRYENFSGTARATLKVFGKQSALDSVTLSFTGGNALTISTVPAGLDLLGVTFSYDVNVNPTTLTQIIYPEPTGKTSIITSKLPTFHHFNQSGTLQAFSNWQVSNSSGILTLQKTGLVANVSYIFTANF